jgi:hypothetical protein
VEVQSRRNGGRWPAEEDLAVFNAIRLVSACGNERIVVLAAGNNGLDLGLVALTNGRLFADPDKHPQWDSGAIIVGACNVDAAGAHPLVNELGGNSNFGERVDCFAWGARVETCGGTPLSPTASYTNIFGGTSSAAAIVAGAATLVQGMHLKRPTGSRPPLRACQIRELLSTTGTASNKAIGRMPDLKAIKGKLNQMP